MDANGDGYVTVAEGDRDMTPEQFAAANTNGDDGLSQEEFAGRRRRRTSPPPTRTATAC